MVQPQHVPNFMTADPPVKHRRFVNHEVGAGPKRIDAVGAANSAEIEPIYRSGLGDGDPAAHFTEEGAEVPGHHPLENLSQFSFRAVGGDLRVMLIIVVHQ